MGSVVLYSDSYGTCGQPIDSDTNDSAVPERFLLLVGLMIDEAIMMVAGSHAVSSVDTGNIRH